MVEGRTRRTSTTKEGTWSVAVLGAIFYNGARFDWEGFLNDGGQGRKNLEATSKTTKAKKNFLEEILREIAKEQTARAGNRLQNLFPGTGSVTE